MRRHLLGLFQAESACLHRLVCAKASGQSERVRWEERRLLSLHAQIERAGAVLWSA